eukprot:Awhi_evm1s5675
MESNNLVKTRLSAARYKNRRDKLNKKSKYNLYQKIQLDELTNAKYMKKGAFKMKRFQKEWFDGDDAHRSFNNYGNGKISCDILVNKTTLLALNMTLVSDFFISPVRITYSIRLSITHPSTLDDLSNTFNLVSTSNDIPTNTLTYSSRVITFFTSITATTTTHSYKNSNSLNEIHDPTLFPTFISLKSKIQSYQLKNNEIKYALNFANRYDLNLWEK